MLLSKYEDKKVTPNQYAKELIEDKIYSLLEGYWEEELTNMNYETCKDELLCTEKELEQVREQLEKRTKGVLKYLGVINK
jgi:hypothetical protein|tara:strand:+ start:858 stop:1097 length:240 start_codon:yes stop_codon:yes gene_type:complete